MVRDQEIQRLVNYAKGLGLKVTFSSKKSDNDAEWYIDNSGLIIYKNKNTPKIDIVLSLIHEIGHSKHSIWEKDRGIDSKFDEALTHFSESEEKGIDPKKRQRKVLLDYEIAGTNYWHEIYTDTNMKFPIWRLEAQMEFDIWQFEYFYENGVYPSKKIKKVKLKEINEKHRNRND